MTAQELSDHLKRSGRGVELEESLKKLGFSLDFVAQHVLSVSQVTVSHVAMLWIGMPNKHDRKRTRELFVTLSGIGLLSPVGDDETWRVVNAGAQS